MDTPNTSFRIFELDSLRGIAALVVVMAHISNYAPASTGTQPYGFIEEYWTIFFSGRLAVLLFFCISGFVLSYPYFSGSKPQNKLKVDVLNRLPRLFVPIFIAGCFGFLLQWIASEARHVNVADVFASQSWVQRWSVSDWSLLDAIRFLATDVLFFYDRTHSFNINLWTMPVEFAFSMMVFAMVALWFRLKILAILLVLIWILLIYCWGDTRNIVLLRVTDGMQFFSGVTAALIYSNDKLRKKIYGYSASVYGVIFGLGLVISFVGGLLRQNGILYGYLVDHLAAALVFFSFLFWCGKPTMFSHRISIFLGHISFELYLIHGAVFYFVFTLTASFVPSYGYKEFLIGSALCIPSLLALSYFMSAKIEAPIVSAIRAHIAKAVLDSNRDL